MTSERKDTDSDEGLVAGGDTYPRRYWWVVLVVVPVLAALLPELLKLASTSARSETVATTSTTEESRTLRVTGYGLAPDSMEDPGRRRAAAKRAAIIDAQRQLAEQLEGALLSSRSVVDDGVLTTDEIESQITARVRGAKIVSERQVPEGGYEVQMELDTSVNRDKGDQ